MVALPLGRHSTCLGHHCETPCFLLRVALYGENLVLFCYVAAAQWHRALLGGTTPGGLSQLVAVEVVGRGGVACVQRREYAHNPCWREGSEAPWVLEVLSLHARRSGDLGDGSDEVLLT